jgi:GNAT superfamily N-acetyltransferase
MKIRFEERLPDKNQLFELFLTTAWNDYYKLDKDELFTAFSNSWYTQFAYANDRLVGMGRMLCDEVCHALILDMIVHPEYQRKGIGSDILERFLKKCQDHNIRDIQLFSARDKIGFYTSQGFAVRPADAPGMEFFQSLEFKLKGE